MGVGVNARGSDGYYAPVYCWCFIFYGRQYVSYSIYCIFEEFHSRMNLSFEKSSDKLVTVNMIVTLIIVSYFMLYLEYIEPFFSFFLQRNINFTNYRLFFSKIDGVLEWNPSFRFVVLFLLLLFFRIPGVWACSVLLGALGEASVRLQTVTFHRVSLPLLVPLLFFPLEVVLASLWSSVGARFLWSLTYRPVAISTSHN